MENTIIINNAEELRASIMANRNVDIDINECIDSITCMPCGCNIIFKEGKYYYSIDENNEVEIFIDSKFDVSKISEIIDIDNRYMAILPNDKKTYLRIKKEDERVITKFLISSNLSYDKEDSAGMLLAQERTNAYCDRYDNDTTAYIKNDIFTDSFKSNDLYMELSDKAYKTINSSLIEQEVENIKNIFKKL